MSDLTILFITSNKIPKQWAEYHKSVLIEAAGNYPIIIISRESMDWGSVNILDAEKPSCTNFYTQILRGCKVATTPYIAIAEDDTLYNKEHFSCFRPEMDVFGYNMNRWSLSTWTEPLYTRRDSKVGAATICPRQEMIDALEEKFAKFPDGIPPMKIGEPGTGGEEMLGVKIRKSKSFMSKTPIIQMNHDYFTNAENTPEGIARRHKKSFGIVSAIEIPYWGRAEDVLSKFK